ncbi:hypothetical protein EJB05_00645, partial [Eragrostis curvula]
TEPAAASVPSCAREKGEDQPAASAEGRTGAAGELHWQGGSTRLDSAGAPLAVAIPKAPRVLKAFGARPALRTAIRVVRIFSNAEVIRWFERYCHRDFLGSDLAVNMDLAPFKLDIDELLADYAKENYTSFADFKRVWTAKKFSYIYEGRPKTNS